MTKNKLIFIAIASGIVLLIIVALLITQKNPPQSGQTFLTPSPAQKIRINNIQVNNIVEGKSPNPDYGNIEFSKSENFVINYFPEGEYFQIGILNSPFKDVRKTAETEFLKKLGITEVQACTLKVEITTPFFANPSEAGAPYPLSFCGAQ